MRTLRELRADNGPLGPYGCGHFTTEESAALLTVAEAAKAWHECYSAISSFTSKEHMSRAKALRVALKEIQ